MADMNAEAAATMNNCVRHGAPIRLAEIDAEQRKLENERAAILLLFPGIEHPHATDPTLTSQALDKVAKAHKTKGRRTMTTAERAAIGRRMRRYWKKRRAEKD